MNAKEARKIAEEKRIESFNNQFNDVMELIKTAAEKGHTNLAIQKIKLDDEFEEYLKEKGYKVKYQQCGMNEYETVISW